ncbi:MAG TPA: PD-(D/E)XK nuclease family protein [Candidatus Solibacter sp.]|nr:PD-(D/E)XK nuclease family protein [Candidatus Solibacter sp.]
MGEPLDLSFSALSLYGSCPLKYRYLHVDGSAEPAVAPDWRRAPATVAVAPLTPAIDRELGLAVHRAISHWQRGVDGGKRPSAAALLAAVAQECVNQRLPQAALARGVERLRPGLSAYAEGPWPRRHTLFLEQPVRHLLSDGAFSVRLSLRVDRVARYQRGVAILDFKTVPPHAIERRADAWQLRTYALAAPELLGLTPEKVALFIIDLRDDREIPVADTVADLKTAAAELIAAARGIAANLFDVGEGHADRPCWECGFRLTCPMSTATDPPIRRPQSH